MYTTLGKLQVDVQSVELEARINDEPITVPQNLENILLHFDVSPGFLHFFNQDGQLVIADTLYTLSDGTVKKVNLVTGSVVTKDLETLDNSAKEVNNLPTESGVETDNMKICDHCDPGDGGGGSGGDDGDVGSGREDYLARYFNAYDINGNLWYGKAFYGNEEKLEAYIYPRSYTITYIQFKQPGESSYYLPSNASTLFPNSSAEANMKFTAKIGGLTCKQYTRGATDEFYANRKKGRCTNTEVESWHTAVVRNLTRVGPDEWVP